MIIRGPFLTDCRENSSCIYADYCVDGVWKKLWYVVDECFGDLFEKKLLDGFLIILLLVAMDNDEDIYIEGIVSERLVYNLTNYYQAILLVIIPRLNKVNIHFSEIDTALLSNNNGGVLTGFSGGVDSFAVVAEHINTEFPNYNITHFVFNDVGSHGKEGEVLFDSRFKRLYEFTQEVNIPFISVASNVGDFINLEFQQTHTSRNASVPHILSGAISKFLYASTYAYKDTHIGETYDSAYSDSTTLNLLSSNKVECISSGGQYSRFQKTEIVSGYEPSYRYLDVCVSGESSGINCSDCWKCRRTLLTLDILGKLDCYSRVFDLDKYYKVRNWYVGEVLSSSDILLQEIISAAKERGYEFSVKQVMKSKIKRFIYNYRSMLNK